MAKGLTLYLIGDQTYDIRPHFQQLFGRNKGVLLKDFSILAFNAIHAEIYKLPQHVSNGLPRLTCFEDLLEWQQSGKQCAPIDMAIACMCHIGIFIDHGNNAYGDSGKSIVIGIFTGALAAAAISCSHSLVDLVPLAVDAVVVAFRTGLRVEDLAKRIAPFDETDRSWSINVPDIAAAEAVEMFQSVTTLSPTSLPYISAYSLDSVTINGPPRSLSKLISSEFFQDFKPQNNPVYGPYQAPHLYSRQDVAQIIEPLKQKGTVIIACDRIQLFPSSDVRNKAFTFAELLTAAVEQILMNRIAWKDVLVRLQAYIVVEIEEFRIVPIATNEDQPTYEWLKHLLSDIPTLRFLAPALPAPLQITPSPEPKMPKLAIVGMSGRFPSARNTDALWDLLYHGIDVHKQTPSFRWDINTHVDPSGSTKNTSRAPFGCWLDDPAVFDAGFFNIFPRTVPQIDPAQRLALMTTYEAMEEAGMVLDATPSTRRDRIGVFYGVTSSDWMETNSAQDIDSYFIPGGNRAFVSGRINYFFKLTGPSFIIDTACSSSLAGIHMACNALWCGDIDTAIAGGTNIMTNPDYTAGLDRGNFLSRTSNCKTFDDEADGYCRGEGVATVIIKRLDDAIMDKDPVLGVILSASTNHSAESESITRPHPGAQRAIFNKILQQGDLDDPCSVSYVEMHGTGTQTGDVCEMSSVLDVFAPPPADIKGKSRNGEQPLYLGSIKPSIGHGEAVSGVSSLIKVLLMMKNNTIVPHCGIKTKINHKFPTNLVQRNVHIAQEPIPWQRSADSSNPRRAIVNNFSAAGGNSALLLEDAPLEHVFGDTAVDHLRPHVIAFSAKNGISLQGNLRSMLRFLKANPNVHLGQLSYTTTARRIHHQHRAMVRGSTVHEISTKIDAALQKNTGMALPKVPYKVVFAFSGQGVQYPGMGKGFYTSFSVFRDEVHRLDQLGQSQGFPSFLRIFESQERDINMLNTIVVQLASVCMQIALCKLWEAWNITPIAVMGHSLGEYAALNAAGILSDADTIYLVGKRAEMLQERCVHNAYGMLLVQGSVDEIAAVLGDSRYEVACINSPSETVLAGPKVFLETLQELITAASLKSTFIKVPYGFHSSQIDPILDDFKRLASGVAFSNPKLPIICPLNGSFFVTSNGKFDAEYLSNHSRQPVNMLKALLTAQNEGILTNKSTVLEIGPHPMISHMMRDTFGAEMTLLASSRRSESMWQTLGSTLTALYTAGADICWAEYQRDFDTNHKVISLPAYSWNLKEYWIPYVNDWALHKGDPLLGACNLPSPTCTTIHRIVEESRNDKKMNIIVEADMARPDLRTIVQSYEVDGIHLCPPSIYAEIALSLGTYLLNKYQPSSKDNLVDVSDMVISKALVSRKDATKQLLQAHVEVDWPSKCALVRILSFDQEQKLQEHSRCSIRFRDHSSRETLQDQANAIQEKIKGLQDGVSTGISARYNKAMLYRAVRTLNRVHENYRGITEFILNSSTNESFSCLAFNGIKHDGSFHTRPPIIDCIAQACGLTLNCNDATDLDNEVFVNHGWKSFQMFAPMDLDKVYTAYTHAVEGDNKLWHGDVTVFDGDKVVAFLNQISYQGISRRVLRAIVQQENQMKSKTQPFFQQGHTFITDLPLVSPGVTSSRDPQLAKALTIISEESGLPLESLTDDIAFSDIGLDSLLSLNILTRFREEVGIDFDFNSLFFEYPSVGDLKAFLINDGLPSESGSVRSNTPLPSATYEIFSCI